MVMQADETLNELIFHDNFGRSGCQQVMTLASNVSLHARTFNSGSSTVLVVSKVPLPNYRADLDPKAQTEHEVSLLLLRVAQVSSATH